jgi:hypothetical protein
MNPSCATGETSVVVTPPEGEQETSTVDTSYEGEQSNTVAVCGRKVGAVDTLSVSEGLDSVVCDGWALGTKEVYSGKWRNGN